ncbi:MAG: alpha/beta hydrolase [Gemmatimonadaceae bacterium]
MIHEHHITVRRTARYCTLGDEAASPSQVWFVCHGYGQLAARFIRRFAPLDDGTRFILAPEGLSRFYLDGAGGRIGASWMTREDRLGEIDNYVGFLDALYDDLFRRLARERVTVHVLGFSQGAATAARWITRGSAVADHLIVWAGHLPPEVDLHASESLFARTRLTLVAGDHDPQLPPEDIEREQSRLAAAGTPHHLIRFAGGHEIHGPTLLALGGGQVLF